MDCHVSGLLDQSLSTPPVLLAESQCNSTIPSELNELIKKMQTIASFKAFDVAKFNAGINLGIQVMTSRYIDVGSDSNGQNEVFTKRPHWKRHFRNKLFAKQEQIAFLISSRLQLDVVPPTIAIEGYKHIIDHKISETTRANFNSRGPNYEGIVIQEGIDLYENQFILNNDFWKDRKVAIEYCVANLDMDHIFKAIFFNIVTGRTAADLINSAIDRSKKIIEFDNEHIGDRKTNSWLLDYFSECVISPKVIDEFCSKDISIIDSVFQEVSHFPPSKFWNCDTNVFDIEDKTQVNIRLNFQQLKKFLQCFSEIKVVHLKELISFPPLLRSQLLDAMLKMPKEIRS